MLRWIIAVLLIGSTIAPVDAAGNGNNHHAKWRHGTRPADIDEIEVVLPPPTAGATFPQTFDMTAFDATVGTLRYVSPTGSDAAACTLAAPCLTLSRAQTVASTGDAVVCRDGIYRTNDFTVSKGLYFTNYTGETCDFRGSQDVTTTMNAGTVDGAWRYISYTEQPITNGHGAFTTGGNVTGGSAGVGMRVDQMWIGDCTSGPYQSTCGELQQVRNQSSLALGKFWVDETNNRAYLMNADSQEAAIEITQQDNFMSVQAANVTIRGIKIRRYSPAGDDFGAIDVVLVDNFTCDNSELSNISTEGIFLSGTSANPVNGTTINYCTLQRIGFLPLVSTYDFNSTITGLKSNDGDIWDEFTGSPGSGNKFTHSHNMTLVASEIRNNKSHGLWCDQSCYNWVVGSNQITGNTNTGMFFELSDKLLLINNYIQSTAASASAAFKFGGGSTGLRAINNTFVGGLDAVGVYMERRSSPGCSDKQVSPNGSAAYNACILLGMADSDRVDTSVWHNTIDWLPRVDEFYNNILAYPTGVGLCGVLTPLCITDNNTGTNVTAQSILHVAEPGRSIPQTFWDYNVYTPTSGRVAALPNTSTTASVSHATRASLSAALAAAPYDILGDEVHGLDTAGLVNADGSPAASLILLEGSALPMPTDATLNTYIPPGIQCFGVAYQCGP